MDKTAVLKINPDMVRRFPTASTGPEEDQVSFPQSASAHLFTILFKHIGGLAGVKRPAQPPIYDCLHAAQSTPRFVIPPNRCGTPNQWAPAL